MKICTEHWERLRNKIKERGMWHLVANSGADAMQAVVKAINEEPSQFDPLMAANNMIWSAAVKQGGLYLMGQPEDGSNNGHYCPLCEVRKYGNENGHHDSDEGWIDGCAKDILDYVKERKLLDLS